jgi:phosphatidylglycerol:prolipoprotein diacylglycerol transferase
LNIPLSGGTITTYYLLLTMKIFDITIFWIHIAPSYYWLMYALGFLFWYYIIKKRKVISEKILDDLLIYIVWWVVLGWRLWYIIFYDFTYYLNNPFDILKVWNWWMSFHWWVIWVIIAMILFSKKYKLNFYKLADQITLVLPIWLGLGRFWNYLNKELLWFSNYYWPLNVNWRFPSPLIEMLLEWIILFIILNFVYKTSPQPSPLKGDWVATKWFDWQIASLFLILYWVFRIFVEAFFREPDEFIWYIWKYFTLWEIYSLPMIIIWIYFYIKLWKNEK